MSAKIKLKKVERHTIDLPHVQQQFDRSCELLELGLVGLRKYTRNLGMMFAVVQEVIALGVVTKPKAAVVKRCIPIAGQLGAAIFKLGNLGNGDTSYQIEDDIDVNATERVSESYLNTGDWLQSYYWNKIADQKLQLKWLLEFPTEILTRSTTKGPQIHIAMIDSFKAFESDMRGSAKLVEHGLEISLRDPKNQWVKNIGVPTCKLLVAIHEKQIDVSDLVCELLLGHRKQAELTQDYERSADGFISVASCALVKMAREAGLAVNVKSDYVPDVLTSSKKIK